MVSCTALQTAISMLYCVTVTGGQCQKCVNKDVCGLLLLPVGPSACPGVLTMLKTSLSAVNSTVAALSVQAHLGSVYVL